MLFRESAVVSVRVINTEIHTLHVINTGGYIVMMTRRRTQTFLFRVLDNKLKNDTVYNIRSYKWGYITRFRYNFFNYYCHGHIIKNKKDVTRWYTTNITTDAYLVYGVTTTINRNTRI